MSIKIIYGAVPIVHLMYYRGLHHNYINSGIVDHSGLSTVEAGE